MGFLDSLFGRKPSRDAFAALFMATARKKGFSDTLHYNAAEFRLEHSQRAVFNLHHAYRSYCESERAARDKALHAFVATLCASRNAAPAQLDEARAILRPLVRGRGVLEDVRLHQLRSAGRDAVFAPAWRPFGDDCAILLALDYPESTSTLVSGPPESWHITLDEALAIARDNLRDVTTDAFVEVARGVYRGAWSDGYDVSRVLLPDLLHRAPVAGRPVFMIPTRDVLLVASEKDHDALLRMAEFAQRAANTGRAVSPFMFCYEEHAPTRFVPTHPALAHRIDHLAYLYRKDDYDTQKAALDRLHLDEKRDLFVANYVVYGANNDTDTMFSATTWTSGVDTLLPKADRVVMIQVESGATQIVPWQQVESLIGGLLDEEPVYPVRYRTRGFPDAEQLAAMSKGSAF